MALLSAKNKQRGVWANQNETITVLMSLDFCCNIQANYYLHHRLPESCYWPCSSLYHRSASSRIERHVTKAQTGFLNATMSSQNVLHSHQMSVEKSTFWMWWNKICIMDVQLTNLQQVCDVSVMSVWTKITEKRFQYFLHLRAVFLPNVSSDM